MSSFHKDPSDVQKQSQPRHSDVTSHVSVWPPNQGPDTQHPIQTHPIPQRLKTPHSQEESTGETPITGPRKMGRVHPRPVTPQVWGPRHGPKSDRKTPHQVGQVRSSYPGVTISPIPGDHERQW